MPQVFAGKTILKMGIFDKIPTPEWEAFASKRQAFEKPFVGAVQYKTKSFGETME